jgi:leucyl aminopeptidase
MRMTLTFASNSAQARPVWLTTKEDWANVRAGLPSSARDFIEAAKFEPAAGKLLLLPGSDGLAGAVFGLGAANAAARDPFASGQLATLLPAGDWRLANDAPQPTLAALAFLLSSYKFTRYKSGKHEGPRLVCPQGVDAARVESIANAMALGRDLINTPANDMGPQALEDAARDLAAAHGATIGSIIGEALLEHDFPLIHAVGKASPQPPRIVDFSWGQAGAPKVTLVGKGVCFDTGGLDIKPSSAMLLMKKDMGGAATALACARMIMEARLPVRLRVILPIVENAVSGNAFRPGDIYRSRKGLTVEIGNTDAEGRLILADALALADEDAPDLLFDFATLTGAARVALGPDLPPFYCADDALAADIASLGMSENDPVWRMPLWEPYDKMLDGKLSDLNNAPSGPFAGSITAALFLRRFVSKAAAWVHFDVYGWSPSTKPGRPEGGEIQAARMIFALIGKRLGDGALAGGTQS